MRKPIVDGPLSLPKNSEFSASIQCHIGSPHRLSISNISSKIEYGNSDIPDNFDDLREIILRES